MGKVSRVLRHNIVCSGDCVKLPRANAEDEDSISSGADILKDKLAEIQAHYPDTQMTVSNEKIRCSIKIRDLVANTAYYCENRQSTTVKF